MPHGGHYIPDQTVGRIALAHFYSVNFPLGSGFGSDTYTAVSSASWLTIDTSPASYPIGTKFSVAEWNGSGPRVAIITFADLSDASWDGYTVITQDGCAFYTASSGSGNSQSVGYGGATAQPLLVGMNQGIDGYQAPASWVATVDVPWITVTPTSGNYPGGVDTPGSPMASVIHFDVAANTTTVARVGHITIVGAFACGPDAVFTVNQDPAPGGGGTGAPFDGSAYTDLFNLPERWGYYLRSGIATTGIGDAGNAVCLRANKVAPFGGFDAQGKITTSASAHHPRLAYIEDTRRLLCSYDDTMGSYVAVSDDDGQSWGENQLLIPGATLTTISAASDGTVIIAGYVAPTGMATYGTIQAVVRGPGDSAFGAPYTIQDPTGANVLVRDKQFHLCMPHAGERIWVWCLEFSTDPGASEWMSADPDSKSITRVV